MEIHRFEKMWLGLGLLLIVGYIATVVWGATVPGIAMINDQGGQVDSEQLAQGNYEDINFKEPGVRKVGENEYEVYVVSRQFFFQPGTSEPIEVPAGSTVTFYVASADVVHGFELAGTNVNTMVIPGQVSQFTTKFKKPAKYGIVCNEYCGAGHHTMAGTVRVVPQDEFDESTLEG